YLIPVRVTTITPTSITLQGPSRGDGGDICLNPEDPLCGGGFPDVPLLPANDGKILLAIDQKVRLERQAFNAMLAIGARATLNYTVSGLAKNGATQSVTITVLPSPKLTLAYTVPFVVMAGKEAKIRVTVQNVGAGVAHNLSIQSAQPRILASIPDDPGVDPL